MKLKPIAKKHPCKSYSILSELCSFISLIYAAIEWHIITNVSIYEFFLFVYLKPPSPPPSLPLSLYNLLTLQHISHQFVCKWYQRFFPMCIRRRCVCMNDDGKSDFSLSLWYCWRKIQFQYGNFLCSIG